MLVCAWKIIYWLSIDRDKTSYTLSRLKKKSERNSCKEISPSQQKKPLVLTPPPKYPFQQVVSDLFEFEGH